jgi:hypothetical protein
LVVRALLVGFILGFAMVGMLRLSATGEGGALLAETSALKPDAAVNLARFHAWRQQVGRVSGCLSGFWPMRTLA